MSEIKKTSLTLADLVGKAQAQELVRAGDPGALAARYLAVLCGDLMIQLLMRGARGA
jgi:hypothetical protein